MSWLPFVFSRAASFRARWSKRREDGRIIVFIARLFSKSYAETRDRTGDLQIFSLTLSQLSYRGIDFGSWFPCATSRSSAGGGGVGGGN